MIHTLHIHTYIYIITLYIYKQNVCDILYIYTYIEQFLLVFLEREKKRECLCAFSEQPGKWEKIVRDFWRDENANVLDTLETKKRKIFFPLKKKKKNFSDTWIYAELAKF